MLFRSEDLTGGALLDALMDLEALVGTHASTRLMADPPLAFPRSDLKRETLCHLIHTATAVSFGWELY